MVDNRFMPVADTREAVSVGNHPDCGSHSPGRWYCVQTEWRRETEVRDRLEDQGFGVFLPLVMVMRPVKPGIMQATTRPAFPGYLFVRFDMMQARWRSILYTRGVKGMFSATPERPTPVPQAQMDVLFAAGFDRPITEDPRPAMIQAGAKVRVTDGPFTDHEGVCLLDDKERVELLLTIFGRRTPVTVPKRSVEPVA